MQLTLATPRAWASANRAAGRSFLARWSRSFRGSPWMDSRVSPGGGGIPGFQPQSRRVTRTRGDQPGALIDLWLEPSHVHPLLGIHIRSAQRHLVFQFRSAVLHR